MMDDYLNRFRSDTAKIKYRLNFMLDWAQCIDVMRSIDIACIDIYRLCWPTDKSVPSRVYVVDSVAQKFVN